MEVSCEMLLHPELLTNEQIKHVIQQRRLKVQLEILPRDELLDLFHQYCVPYGQRKYRDSGRGRLLNNARHLSPERAPKNTINDTVQNTRKFIHSIANNDRLRPPPDLLSGHMKRIKLEAKNIPVHNDVNNSKRKMSISSESSEVESPPPKKERKPITWP